jgi:hypothetical protein
MMLSKSDFELRIRSSSWTSLSFAVLGVRSDGHPSDLIFGDGFWLIAIEADLFLKMRLLNMRPVRTYTNFVGLGRSDGSLANVALGYKSFHEKAG